MWKRDWPFRIWAPPGLFYVAQTLVCLTLCYGSVLLTMDPIGRWLLATALITMVWFVQFEKQQWADIRKDFGRAKDKVKI